MFFKFFFFIILIVILIVIYFFGNIIESNTDLNFEYKNLYYNNAVVDINNINDYIDYKEFLTDHIIPEKRKEIYWYNQNQSATDYVIYFLHGFNSDKTEGKTFSIKLAQKINANILFARLTGNGVYNKDTSFNTLNFYDHLRDVHDDLILLSLLGNKIILMGSSTGCTYNILVTTLFNQKFNISKNIFFSPNLGLNFLPNIGIKILGSGYGKNILKLTTDKIKIDNHIITPNVFIPLSGSLKAYESHKKKYNCDYIVFISENDELVSNTKVNEFFSFKKTIKKHYYIFKNEKIHPVLFLKNKDDVLLNKIIYFLDNTSENVIKNYLD